MILFCLGGIQYTFSQTHAFTVHDTIPIRAGTNKFRLYRLIEKWFETERGTRLIAKNRKLLHFKGRGYFIYSNRVKIPDIFLSPHANARCKGSIVFTIDVKIQDSVIVSKFTQFIHEAVYSEYGSMSFGMLMIYDKVPPGFCMEVEDWCNAVWNDMKQKSEAEVKDRASRMIPPILIRRRTFKIKEEEVKVVVQDTIDPKEYLELDRYYDPEDKKQKQVSDRTDDIPGITDYVETTTNTKKITKPKAMPVDEPAQEKEVSVEEGKAVPKPEEDTESENQEEEKQKAKKQEDTPKEKPSKKEKEKKDSKPVDEYDQEAEEEVEKPKKVEPSTPKEKPVKEKAAPAPKSKPAPAPKPAKTKKTKPAEEDEYDDYDDYDDE